MSTPTPESKTNSIEIFIDANGRVTFTDLPTELKAVAESLAEFEVQTSSWCDLMPQNSKDEPSDRI